MLERATRWSVIRAVFWRSWVRLVSGAWAIYGVLDFVDSKAVPRLPAGFKAVWAALYVLPSLSWRTWLMIAMAIITVVSIEGAYRFALSHKKQFDELTQNKVTFEVSTDIWESQVCLTDPGQTDDWHDADSFYLDAKLNIRYWNDDKEPVRIYDLRLSIINDVAGKEYPLTYHVIAPNVRPPDAQENHYFRGFVVKGKELTGLYFHSFFVGVPVECALSVDENSYLRLTMDAGKQDPYSVDLKVPWRAARKGLTKVSIRRKNGENNRA